ncbi:polyhydroxyalkanoic acid system family protein [Sphingosinicella sp. BN140058]|uniref:polyhydroxyalkanoic acid system family protein n=1 Tax=Sphingosinicella sp. BN140058 TaxID=1892855 RepID=UPI0013ECB62D|nr:polyhydroxyalkanoic acid system family protein [Sphingosinicella sp. BN140058]
MASPITVDLPHALGAAEAKRRIQNGIGQLTDHLPSGAQVEKNWVGDRLNLNITALGQTVGASLDVQEKLVRVEVSLPGVLSFFGKQIEGLLRRHGNELLEDRSGRKS